MRLVEVREPVEVRNSVMNIVEVSGSAPTRLDFREVGWAISILL